MKGLGALLRPSARAAAAAALLLAAASAAAQGADAAARAFVARHAGSDDLDALLREPALRDQWNRLGPARAQIERNLGVRGGIDLVGGWLQVAGNAPHAGGEEEAVLCVSPQGPALQAAVLSRGRITAYADGAAYIGLSQCIKDWITQANTGHRDRLAQPKNVQIVPRR